MPIHIIKKDIKKHRAIDWFAIAVLISAAFIIASILSSKIDEFIHDMDLEAQKAQSDMLYLKDIKERINRN